MTSSSWPPAPVSIPCSRPGCDKPAAPLWFPVLVLYPPLRFGMAQAIRAVLTLPFCPDCKSVTFLADVLTDEVWKRLMPPFIAVGKILPEREQTRLDWTSGADTPDVILVVGELAQTITRKKLES